MKYCPFGLHHWEIIDTRTDQRVLEAENYAFFWKVLFGKLDTFYLVFKRCKKCGSTKTLNGIGYIEGFKNVKW